MSSKRKLLDVLLRIKRHGPENKKQALCGNVALGAINHVNDPWEARAVSDALRYLSKEWATRTGREYCPAFWVGGWKEWEDEKASGTFWSNPVRLSFLHWAIAWLEDDLGVE